MDIDWIDSADPSAVVGCAPDGGFFVHASLYPAGMEATVQRANQAAIELRYHRGGAYLPMPWLRSELAAMLKQSTNTVSTSQLEEIATVLKETLPLLLEQAELRRSETRGRDRIAESAA